MAFAARLAFTRPDEVSTDPRHDFRRARTLDLAAMDDPRSYASHLCDLHDCADDPPGLRSHGFAHADLSRLPAVQTTLARVRAAGRLAPADIAALRRGLLGRRLALSGGAAMRLLFIARDGFFMRLAGPNGLRLAGDGHHDAARQVHADQDVGGTPLRQILRGVAPFFFNHDTPGRPNLRSPVHLVNVWIPLDQVTRPLALMDRRSLDRRAHQLRYGLPIDGFMRRREHMRINDIWTFLHDPAQRWHFTADIDARTAYVFETLGTPHGSFIVPGEERAEALYHQLTAAITAVRTHDAAALARALTPDDRPWPAPATEPLRLAIAAMTAALDEAHASAAWCTRAAEAAARVVRKSIEMRAIALVTSR